jgi:uncharacterized repeat protein (TIGR01451 family)
MGPVPALTITKSADATAVLPGGTVDYTITVTDTGQTSYPDATLTDPLTDVLDDATYGNATHASVGTASFTTPNLTWTGALSIGETATITYSVTVNSSDDGGDATLTDTVTSPTPGNNCLSGSTDPNCSTTVDVTGVLSITAPTSADLGTTAPGRIVTAPLGAVEVTDNRASLAVDWTATVSSTDFTTGDGTATQTIPVADVKYSISAFTATSGSATFTPASVTVLSSAPRGVVSATNVVGDNSASWNPEIQVSVPSGAVDGLYTATITESVS